MWLLGILRASVYQNLLMSEFHTSFFSHFDVVLASKPNEKKKLIKVLFESVWFENAPRNVYDTYLVSRLRNNEEGYLSLAFFLKHCPRLFHIPIGIQLYTSKQSKKKRNKSSAPILAETRQKNNTVKRPRFSTFCSQATRIPPTVGIGRDNKRHTSQTCSARRKS